MVAKEDSPMKEETYYKSARVIEKAEHEILSTKDKHTTMNRQTHRQMYIPAGDQLT